jgi:uncharacterized RDD family membrane protein YckC
LAALLEVVNSVIRCPNCDRSIEESETQCPHCGAKQLPRRVVLDPRREEFTLTPDEPYEWGDDRERDEAEFHSAHASELGHRPAEPAPLAVKAVRWGGFFRRLLAFLLDALVIVLLAAVMLLLSSIGYKVGLSAYGRTITWHNAVPLLFILTWASVFLASIYFVVFHGGEGRTIGKWLLGLRVVGPEQSAIGYGRAFFRWVVMVILAPLGLGFLWILWSSEKRGWHDYLARTWVIRD